MKFVIGDTTDSAHCTALKHEFLSCEDAFQDFEKFGGMLIMQRKNKKLAFKAYNAYSRFIHHLYEFLMGATQRDIKDTAQIPAERADLHISAQVQRALTKRRAAVLNSTAPSWENQLQYFPEKIPMTLAADFRRYRNKIHAHVTYKRSGLSLSDFYEKYHKFLHIIYFDCLGWWGLHGNEFPDLKEITDFSLVLRNTPIASSTESIA